VILFEASGAEDRDARPDEMQTPKALHALAKDARGLRKLEPTRSRPLEELAFGGVAAALAPVIACVSVRWSLDVLGHDFLWPRERSGTREIDETALEISIDKRNAHAISHV
jgi:hypothetical protein